MKKLIATGTMLAVMVAGAAPAFADATAGDVNLRFVDASQTQAAAALQINRGDTTATSRGVASAADASIDQSLSIDQRQVNGGFDNGFNNFNNFDDGFFGF